MLYYKAFGVFGYCTQNAVYFSAAEEGEGSS